MVDQEHDTAISLSEEDKTKLRGMLTEMTRRMDRIEQEKQAKDEIASNATALFGLKKKYINKLANTMHKRNFGELQSENSAFEFLYEAVIRE